MEDGGERRVAVDQHARPGVRDPNRLELACRHAHRERVPRHEPRQVSADARLEAGCAEPIECMAFSVSIDDAETGLAPAVEQHDPAGSEPVG